MGVKELKILIWISGILGNIAFEKRMFTKKNDGPY